MTTSRREIKYILPLIRFKQLESRLVLTLHRDTAGGPGGLYNVRSLYFDSLHDDDYFDVLRGAEARKKIRLRVYPPYGQAIKLEYKFKHGVNQKKTSITVSREQALSMIEGDYGFIRELSHPLAMTIYREMAEGAYRPKLLLEYTRQAYTAPGNDIRVTFDTNIRASLQYDQLFLKMVNYTPLTAEDSGVLEVKYNRFLYTYVQNTLRGLDALPTAMGKYILGRTALH